MCRVPGLGTRTYSASPRGDRSVRLGLAGQVLVVETPSTCNALTPLPPPPEVRTAAAGVCSSSRSLRFPRSRAGIYVELHTPEPAVCCSCRHVGVMRSCSMVNPRKRTGPRRCSLPRVWTHAPCVACCCCFFGRSSAKPRPSASNFHLRPHRLTCGTPLFCKLIFTNNTFRLSTRLVGYT